MGLGMTGATEIAAGLNLAQAHLLAASTQRTIGTVLAALAIGGFIIYWVFNWFQGRAESGSETELAPNRKPYYDDEELETKKLDASLFAGLLCLVVIGIALPLYWLGEPGRQEGLVAGNDNLAVSRGAALYEENCASCHGTVSGAGGKAPDTLADLNGLYLANVTWKAPSLATVLYRYSWEEVEDILNLGRPQTPMPAWGAPGGGPFTTQQIDEVIAFLASEQVGDVAALRDRVDEGLANTIYSRLLKEDPDLEYNSEDLAKKVEELKDNPVAYGELLFNNEGDNGVYGCARCHTPGWSFDSDEVRAAHDNNPLIPEEVPGGGALGPSLTDGATLRQFNTAAAHAELVHLGSQNGVKYGNAGQGDGQMPAFGTCVADRDAGERDFITRDGFCDNRGGAGLLTAEQIAAIVAYERSLDGSENETP